MTVLALIDDHATLAESVAREIERRGIANPVVIDPSQPQSLSTFLDCKPDACLIDLDLGHERSAGLLFLERAVASQIPAAMFTGSTDNRALGTCIARGALGVISKVQGLEEAIEGVENLVGARPINSDTDLLRWVLAAQQHRQERQRGLADFDQLSARERKVLQHLIDGDRVDEIAASDFVTVATVRSQVQAVLRKLGVHSQLEAVAKSHSVGWFNDTDRSA